MQQLLISPRQQSSKMTQFSHSHQDERNSFDQYDTTQDFSISMLEWLNAELRKEVEKQEIVALHTDFNVMGRLQNMLTSKVTGITIMVASLFMI